MTYILQGGVFVHTNTHTFECVCVWVSEWVVECGYGINNSGQETLVIQCAGVCVYVCVTF